MAATLKVGSRSSTTAGAPNDVTIGVDATPARMARLVKPRRVAVSRQLGVACFVLLALLPSLLWIALDQATWKWDQAYYGAASVTLYSTLRHQPDQWPAMMLGTFGSRAPGIAWFGQFFVPLGHALNSVELGLMLSNVATQALTLTVLFGAYRQLADRRTGPALVGCLAVAAAPLFVANTHQYVVEPLQCLGVAWFIGIMAFGREWGRPTLLAHLIGATAIAMLARVSSPLFCLLPGLAGVWLLLRGQAPQRSADRRNGWRNIVGLVAATLLGIGTVGWYAENWAPLAEFARSASSGSISEFYGGRAPFLDKLSIWLDSSMYSFSYPAVLIVMAVLIGLAVLAVASGRRRDWSAPVPWSAVAVAVAVLEIGLTLCVFSTQVNQERRNLLPLAPFAGLLLACALAKLGSPPATLLAASVLVVQWGLLHAQALGIMPPQPGVSYHLTPVTLDHQDRDDVEAAVAITCPSSGAGHNDIVGVDVISFNSELLSFQGAKHEARGAGRCYYASLGYLQSDVNRAWDDLLARKFEYFITLNPAEPDIPNDFLNRVSRPILERVRTSELFTPVPTNGAHRFLIFKYWVPR